MGLEDTKLSYVPLVTEEMRVKSSGFAKFGTIEMHSIIKKEDLIEY